MSEKEKIPCRVCRKLFEPCSTCQSGNSMFRWRNFACSKRCAEKYISDTITYRESQKHKDELTSDLIGMEKAETEILAKKKIAVNKKNHKRIITDLGEAEIENNKTE